MPIQIKSVSKPKICPMCHTPDSLETATESGNPVWKCHVPECQHIMPRTENRASTAKSTVPPRRENTFTRNMPQSLSETDYGRQIAEEDRKYKTRRKRFRIAIAIIVVIIIGVIGLLIAFNIGDSDISTSTHTPSVTPSISSLPDTPAPTWKKFESNNGYFYGYSDSLVNGYVEYHYDNGSIYKGSFADTDGDGLFEKNGEGEYITDNYTYMGHFSNGEFDGYGEITWNNGDVYKGDWENGARIGTGEYYWPNGNWYKGTFVSVDYAHINGTGQYKRDAVIYEGMFTDGKLSGDGKLYTGEWTIIYDGSFNNDKFHGNGTYYFPNSGGRFTYDGWDMGGTEVMHLTINDEPAITGKWLHNDFYGLLYENGQWVSVEIVSGIKSYAGDYDWMLDD